MLTLHQIDLALAEWKTRLDAVAARLVELRSQPGCEILDTLHNNFSAGPAAEFGRFLPQVTRGIVNERRLPPGASVKLTEEATVEISPQSKAG